MKKLLSFMFAAAVTAAAYAADDPAEAEKAKDAEARPQAEEQRYDSPTWPAFLAVWQVPHAPDVVGLRITIPYSTAQENVTGIDLGLWGRCLYFEGVQLNLLRCDVVDDGAGVQVGIYNSIGHGDMLGVQVGLWNEARSQVGLWNEARSMRGVQVGLINVAGDAEGFQVGLINRAESLHGYQLGLVNVIRSAEFQFFPIINIGF